MPAMKFSLDKSSCTIRGTPCFNVVIMIIIININIFSNMELNNLY